MKRLAKYENILAQAHKEILNIAEDSNRWRMFLDSAAHTTQYAFPNQVLIAAQNHSATILADIETWNTVYGRWVYRGSHGMTSRAIRSSSL